MPKDFERTPSGGGISNVVEDTTPQLGGDLDANAFDIQFDDATGIRDDSDNEQLIFQKTASAVNYVEITNAATGGHPLFAAVGDDANVDLHLVAKGTGDVAILDPADTTSIMKIDPAAIATATTRTLTMPDQDVDLTPDTGTFLGTAGNNAPGKTAIWLPASSWRPTVSNGCAALADVETTAGNPDMTVLDFDNIADEHAQFNMALGNRYDLGTVTFKVYWTQSVGAVSTGVAWALQGLASSDNESLDTAYGTAVVVTDDAQGAVEEVYITAESGAVTLGGTPADADYISLRLFRDVSDANDDLAGDARLLGVMVFFTSDQHNDA